MGRASVVPAHLTPVASSRSPPRVPNSLEDSHSPGVLLAKPRASPVCLRRECDNRFQSAEWTVQAGRREVRSHSAGRLSGELAFQHGREETAVIYPTMGQCSPVFPEPGLPWALMVLLG